MPQNTSPECSPVVANVGVPHPVMRAHELASVFNGVVVRLFVREDETCWVSAASTALLAGCPLPELLSSIDLCDLSHEGVTLEAPQAANLYCGPLPVISAAAFSHLVDTLPALSEMADELDCEVFAAFHRGVMNLRNRQNGRFDARAA